MGRWKALSMVLLILGLLGCAAAGGGAVSSAPDPHNDEWYSPHGSDGGDGGGGM